jgi:amino acid transporter
MNTGPAFWIIMTIGGVVLLGVALTYAMLSRRALRNESSDRRK